MPLFQVHDVKEFSPNKFVLKIPIQTPQARCRVYCLEPGQKVPVHQHQDSVDVFHVIEGMAEVALDDQVYTVGPGMVVLVSPNQTHGMANPGPKRLVFTSVYIPGQ